MLVTEFIARRHRLVSGLTGSARRGFQTDIHRQRMNLHDEKLEAVHRDIRTSSTTHVSMLRGIETQLNGHNALIKTSLADTNNLTSSMLVQS